MKHLLSGSFLSVLAASLLSAALPAQRGAPRPSATPRASAPSAPRPSAPRSGGARPSAPRQSAPRPQAVPRSMPATPRPATPRSIPQQPRMPSASPRPQSRSQPRQPRSTPQFQPRPNDRPSPTYQPPTPRNRSQPGVSPSRGGLPRYTRPDAQQPSASRVGGVPNLQPRTPGTNPAPAVGGRVRTVSPSRAGWPADRANLPKLSPRDIYERNGKPGSTGVGSTRQRPLTADVVAGRYRPRSEVKLPTAAPRRDTVGAAPRTRDGGRATPGVVKRFAPGAQPGAVRGTRGSEPRLHAGTRTGTRTGMGAEPRLRPRVSGTVGPTQPGAPHLAPRLAPRSRTVGLVGSAYSRGFYPGSYYAGSCFGPLWDPYFAHCASYYPCWSPSLSWTVGIGFGSFCWGWSSYYPWHCWRSFCGPYWGFSYRPSSWYWPSWCYTPTTLYVNGGYVTSPSSVVVVDRTVVESPAEETIVAGAADRGAATPADLARKYVALGDFYFREGRFSEAADAYARAKTYAPEDGTVHFALADAVFAVGDYHFAAFLIGEGLRLDPNLASAETDKRLLYGDVKLFESQMQTLLRYLDDKPYDAMAHLVLGYNLKFSGRRAEAETAFRRVLEIDGGNLAAQRFLAAMSPVPAEAAPKAPAAGESGR